MIFATEQPKDNILNRQFDATRPNQKWLTDITYIQIGDHRLYFSGILDLFNNEIVAYRKDDSCTLSIETDTFEKRSRLPIRRES